MHPWPSHRALSYLFITIFCLASVPGAFAWAADKPLPPEEARKQVGQQICVEMLVRVGKDRLEKRGEIYLDSEEDFRDEKNFAIVVTKTGADDLRAQGIASPAEHFQGKRVQARGLVLEVDGVPRIEINSAQQIKLVPETAP